MNSSPVWSLQQTRQQYGALLDTIVTPTVDAAAVAETTRLLDEWWTSNASQLPHATRAVLARLYDLTRDCVAGSGNLTNDVFSEARAHGIPDIALRAPPDSGLGLDTLLFHWQRSAARILEIQSWVSAQTGAGLAVPDAARDDPGQSENADDREPATLGAMLQRYQDAMSAYTEWGAAVSAGSFERVRQRLQNADREVTATVRELLKIWVDCAEAQYAEASRTDHYSRCCGALVNALAALRICADRTIEPTRLRSATANRPAPATGISPREVVFRKDQMTLYAYRAGCSPRRETRIPILVVYALVNRPHVLDLAEGRSTIQGLLGAGLDPFLIDWGYPEPQDRELDLNAYINGYLDLCVDEVCRSTGTDKINLLGVCQGGTFALCYSALNPKKVANLVTMVTPVDFHTPDNQLTRLIRGVDVDALVQAVGNIPGELLNWTFVSLKPFQLTVQKYIDVLDKLDDERALRDFVAMENWILDSPDQAGAAFRQFAKDFFQDNKLVRGAVKIGGRRVDLGAIDAPVLNVYGTQDHLVPPDASRALGEHLVNGDYRELAFDGGHIGIYVSRRAQQRIAPAIGAWLRERIESTSTRDADR